MPPRQAIDSKRAKQKTLSWPVLLFLVGLAWPCLIYIGPLRMSLYRIVLFVMIVPCLAMFVSGRGGRLRVVDVALLLFACWRAISLIVISGLDSSLQTCGIEFIETAGAYLLARCFVRDANDFYNVIQLLFRIVAVLLPFAIIEIVTGQNVLLQLFAAICPTYSTNTEARLGLTRVQSVFDHPILFGVFASSVFALTHMVLGYRKNLVQRNFRTGVVGAATLLSLSAGPLIAIIVQGMLLSWNALLGKIKARWQILIGIVTAAYLTVQITANRSLLAIVSSYLTFDDQSYWYRRVIWDYGSASVLNNPLFGVGLNDWERPKWMLGSIDNFWLFLAVKYGLPAACLLLIALLSLLLSLAFKKGLDGKMSAYRTAFLITMTGFFIVSWTVAFWDAAYVLLVFLMGSGVWMLNVETKKTVYPTI